MRTETLLLAGGVYHVLLIVFHLGFRRIFRWDADLAKLTFLNRQIMPVLNLCLTAVFAMLAVLSFAYPAELAATPMGRAILLMVAGLWALRTLLQVTHFGLRKPLSFGFLAYFACGCALYLGAWAAGA